MKNKSTLSFSTIVMICCFSVLLINKTYAQERGIYELKDDIANKQNSKQIKGKSVDDRNEFYNLAHKLHSTYYIDKTELKKIKEENTPVKINFTGSNSFSKVNLNDSKYSDIELITITLKKESDLNSPLDLSNILGLTKLKYIYVKCLFNCNANQIKQFVIKPNTKVRVFYTSVSPS